MLIKLKVKLENAFFSKSISIELVKQKSYYCVLFFFYDKNIGLMRSVVQKTGFNPISSHT